MFNCSPAFTGASTGRRSRRGRVEELHLQEMDRGYGRLLRLSRAIARSRRTSEVATFRPQVLAAGRRRPPRTATGVAQGSLMPKLQAKRPLVEQLPQTPQKDLLPYMRRWWTHPSQVSQGNVPQGKYQFQYFL
jgi:hypothetical protein